jgi:hypothetical protein
MKLIKTDVNYLLEDNKGVVIGSTSTKEINKLSKENCDEIFWGLYDTEIEVEIELICPHPSDTYRCGIQYGCDGDGCNHPDQVPYLDSEGCLILKKI